MATLANTSGARLVGNFGETLGAGIEAGNVRRRAADDQLDLEGKIADALGLGGPSSQVVDDAALGRLGQLAPGMAQAVGAAKGNPEAAGQLLEQAQQGLALSQELQDLPDHAARLKRLATEAGTVAASGGDMGRLVKLSNLSEAELGLELQRMQLIGKDVVSSLPPPAPTATSAFAALIADNPQIGTSLLGRRDTQIAQERSRRAAAARAAASARSRANAAAGPQGEFAKSLAQIEGNFTGGHISEADRDQRIANLRTDFASAPASEPFKGATDEGKIIEDRLNLTDKFGVDSPVIAKFDDMILASGTPPPEDQAAPKTITQARADGSTVTVQWTPDASEPQGGSWTPLETEGVGTVLDSNASLTEGEAKMTLFNSMMEETQPVLLDIETQFNPANIPDAVARNTKITGNFFTSSEGQIYNTAAAAWAEGALRLATGAAATPEEIVRTRETYFAKPGDTPTTVDFKSNMREMYSRSIQRALGNNVDATLQTPEEFTQGLSEVISHDPVSVPAAALSDPSLIATAERNGIPVEELWGFLSQDAKDAILGGAN